MTDETEHPWPAFSDQYEQEHIDHVEKVMADFDFDWLHDQVEIGDMDSEPVKIAVGLPYARRAVACAMGQSRVILNPINGEWGAIITTWEHEIGIQSESLDNLLGWIEPNWDGPDSARHAVEVLRRHADRIERELVRDVFSLQPSTAAQQAPAPDPA